MKQGRALRREKGEHLAHGNGHSRAARSDRIPSSTMSVRLPVFLFIKCQHRPQSPETDTWVSSLVSLFPQFFLIPFPDKPPCSTDSNPSVSQIHSYSRSSNSDYHHLETGVPVPQFCLPSVDSLYSSKRRIQEGLPYTLTHPGLEAVSYNCLRHEASKGEVMLWAYVYEELIMPC